MSDELAALKSGLGKPPRFYVYQLINPITGSVFYVGKGQGFRAWAHEKAVRAGKKSNKSKSEIIAQIIEAGLSVGVQIVSRHSCELEAYQAESALIAAIGLDNLTNCNSGGHGSFSDRTQSSRLSELSVGADAIKLLISIGSAKDWISARKYSLEAGLLWYNRITEALKKIANAVIAKHGASAVKEYMVAHG